MLPSPRAYSSFKRANNLISYPAPIKIPLRRLHLLSIDITCIHFAWIDGDIVGKCFIGMGWMAVVPRGIGDGLVANGDGIVRCRPLPFTERDVSRRFEVLRDFHILWWKVIARRVARL